MVKTRSPTEKPYVQYSKRVVTAVVTLVTLLCAAAIALGWESGDMTVATDVVRAYIQFATVVFVAYSGNSAVEKWLVQRAKTSTPSQTDEADTASNG